MAEQWQYQIRVDLSADFAKVARANPSDPVLKPLNDVLAKFDAVIKNQFDAFSDFCAGAEAAGETDSGLYKWTKATIERPGKAEQYATRFTVYADGGREVYDAAIADALEADLQPLLASGLLTRVNKIDSNPARNPQAPAKYHR